MSGSAPSAKLYSSMSDLVESLTTTQVIAELFSDKSILRSMLHFEAALARAEAGSGIIPPAAADAITNIANTAEFDSQALAQAAFRAGTVAIPFVQALTERVRAIDSKAAGFVHWGTTSQDVSDTALVLVLKQVRGVLEGDHSRLITALRGLSERYAETVMLGRTLLQPAPPITFGLKAAGWLAAARRGWTRIESAFDEALILQFGGASGTLAALGDKGIEVGTALAKELGLSYPDAPWHTHRDRLAALMAALGVYTASLGKMARDIEQLMQMEVAEAAEPGGDGRGGSSTMPHKRNPIACSLTLAAAYRVPGLVATLLSTMVQEHERATGGWQAELATISELVGAVGVATGSMREAAEGLAINQAMMLANIQATRGLVFAERASMLLGSQMGRDSAHELLEQAARQAATEGRGLTDVLKEIPEVMRVLSAETLAGLEVPKAYLGMAHEFRARLVRGNTNTDTPEE